MKKYKTLLVLLFTTILATSLYLDIEQQCTKQVDPFVNDTHQTKEEPSLEIFIKGIESLKEQVEKEKSEGKEPPKALGEVTNDDSMDEILKSMLNHKSEDEGHKGFFDIIKELKEEMLLLKDIATKKMHNEAWKALYKLIAPTELPPSIKGGKWTNWGQTLRNTPAFIFSDEAIGKDEQPRYLLFQDDQFYLKTGMVTIEWDENLTTFSSPVTLEHLFAVIALGGKKGLQIKAFGTTHSWSPVCTTNGIVVDNKKINLKEGILSISVNPEDPLTNHPAITSEGKLRPTVTCSPGIQTGTLEKQLWEKGYSLAASTIEDVFTIGGIVATSSHGVGRDTTALSDLVVAMTIVVWNGEKPELFKITPTSCPEVLLKNLSSDEKDLTPEDVWRVVQVNLGSFGLIWDMTLVVEPQMYAYFVTETAKWSDYFSDTEASRKRLAELTEKWDTLEFWHYPFTFKGKGENLTFNDLLTAEVTPSDHVYIWKTVANKPPEGYTVVEEDFENLYAVWVKQTLGAKFSGRMMSWIYTNKFGPEFLMPRITAFTTYGTQDRFGNEDKKIAWKIPQWFANHPYPAISVVEPIEGVLDIEWSVPITLNDETGEGLRPAANVFGHLIQSVRDEFYKKRYPVTTSIEMRFLKGSGSPISPLYIPGLGLSGSDYEKRGDIRNRAYGVPEIVSHTYNPYWLEFYERMNKDVTGNKSKFGSNIKPHLAKQYSSIKNMFTYLKNIYRDQSFTFYPYEESRREEFKYKDVIELWKTVRNRFDPKGIFLNPFIEQLFYSENAEYKPPVGFEVDEAGFGTKY